MTRSLVAAFILVTACAPSPTATFVYDPGQPTLCETDAVCPAGSYCQAGVCDEDCTTGSEAVDCAGGTCDVRGRCSTDATSPAFAGALSLSASRLDLATGQTTATLHLENTGAAALSHFHVISDDPSITVSPVRGALAPGEGIDVTVTRLASWLGVATLRTLSSGGTGTTLVTASDGLVGHLQGQVSIETPYALGTADLGLDLNADLTGVVDDAQSLLWPARAAVTASDNGTNATITFTLVAPARSWANPAFDGQLERVVTLAGTHQGSGPLSGTYTEVVSGLGSMPVTVGGHFQLSVAGLSLGLLPQAMAPFAAPTAPAPWPSPVCILGLAGCPADLDQRAYAYFQAAFPFEQLTSYAQIVNGECLALDGSTQACVDSQYELADAEAFAAGSNPARVWEVWRAIASGALLRANDLIANTLEPAEAEYQGPAEDAVQLAQAATTAEGGLHQALGSGGLITAANLWRAQAVPANGPSQLDLAPGDLQRFGGSVSAELFAVGQELDRQRRSRVAPSETLDVAQRAATVAFLDAAALSTLTLDGTGPSGQGHALLDTAANFAAVSQGFHEVGLGLNAVGFPEDYIPFDYDAASPTLDIFQQLSAQVTTVDLPTATALETALESADRAFEQSQAALTSALTGVSTQLASQVTALCGSSAGSCTGGQLETDFDNMNAATLAMQEAATRAADAADKIGMLNTMLQNETNNQAVEIEAVTSDGQSEAAAAIAEARQQKQNLDWQCATSSTATFGNLISGIGSFVEEGYAALPGVVGSLLQSGSSTADACEQANNFAAHVSDAGQAALAATDATLQIQTLQNEIHDDQLVASIADAMADSDAAFTEAQRQEALLGAARSQMNTDLATLQQDLDNAQRLQSVQVRNADPTFRLYEDQTGIQWADAMVALRTQVFLATQAFDYMTNQTYAQEAEVFAAAKASDLAVYMSDLSDAYEAYALANGWGQDFEDVLSLRRDILGITQPLYDPITGVSLSPAQQFEVVLSEPRNRDAVGNLALQFNTDTAAGGVALFSPDVCEDRVLDLKMSIVSSELSGESGYVGLSQGADTRLLDCAQPGTARAYMLSPKEALVTAGLNLPMSAATDSTVPANTDLFGRPVRAGTWVLSIDASDPRNSWIDLGKIEDIEIFFHHQALTVQSP